MLIAIIACAFLTSAFIPTEAVASYEFDGTSVLSHSEGPQTIPGVEAPGSGAATSADAAAPTDVRFTIAQAEPQSEVKPAPAPTVAEATITVNPKQWGVSTRYIGGTEGATRFDLCDFVDSGVNTLRIYGDMSRFEPVDDDGVYGSPTIAEIKANPNAIPWNRWDEIMDSAYSPEVIRPVGQPQVTWRSVFADLRRAGVKTVVSLRNRDTALKPEWIAAVPKTEKDWNEWWEYCFAMAYWLNVRNDYRVDDFEVLNEPDNAPQQGWLGTIEEYGEMVRVANDALNYVYKTYLPGRSCYVHAPATSGPAWVPGVLADVGDHFNALNLHNYAWWDKGEGAQKMHQELTKAGHPDYPIWLSEWGTYDVSYDVHYMALAVVDNLIRFSQPGDDYIYGSHIFSFYDWTYEGVQDKGVISGSGKRRGTYYAMRLAIRALKDGKPTFQAIADSKDLMAIATKDLDGTLNLLVLNWSETTSYNLKVDLSGLMKEGTGSIREFSATAKDEVTGCTLVIKGESRFTSPAYSVVLVQYRGAD